MMKNRTLNVAEPISEGSHLKGKVGKEDQLVKTPLSSENEKQLVIGKASNRSKSESSLESVSSKKRRNVTSGSKPFTIHEDVTDDKASSSSVQSSSPTPEVQTEKLHQPEPKKPVSEPTTSSILKVHRSDKHWEDEAENLRRKLEIALEENRMVWEQLNALKAENREMKEALDEAVYLADVLKEQMDREDARTEVGTQTDVDM